MTYYQNLEIIDELACRDVSLYDLEVAQNVQDAACNLEYQEVLEDEKLFNFICSRVSEVYLGSESQDDVLNDLGCCSAGIVRFCSDYNFDIERLKTLSEEDFRHAVWQYYDGNY